MLLIIFLKGFIIGLAVAAPVGPIGILCIHRSLCNGFKIGLLTGLGAALADGIYGAVAGFGLTAVSSFLVNHKTVIQSIGGLFLLYLGCRIALSQNNVKEIKDDSESSSLHAMLTTFLLTLSNPITILSFIAIFAGLGLGSLHTDYVSSVLLVAGVIIGSACWWLILSCLAAKLLKQKLTPIVLKGITVISGIIILLFGIISLTSALI